MAFLVIYAAGMENDFLSFCRRQDVRALVGGVKPWGGPSEAGGVAPDFGVSGFPLLVASFVSVGGLPTRSVGGTPQRCFLPVVLKFKVTCCARTFSLILFLILSCVCDFFEKPPARPHGILILPVDKVDPIRTNYGL